MKALSNLSSAAPAEEGGRGGVAVGSPSDLHPAFFGFHVLFSARSVDCQSAERWEEPPGITAFLPLFHISDKTKVQAPAQPEGEWLGQCWQPGLSPLSRPGSAHGICGPAAAITWNDSVCYQQFSAGAEEHLPVLKSLGLAPSAPPCPDVRDSAVNKIDENPCSAGACIHPPPPPLQEDT